MRLPPDSGHQPAAPVIPGDRPGQDLSVNAVAAFMDDRLNAMLGLDGRVSFANLLIGLGHRPGRPT